MSRRPFSIAELAARSRPTGYDASRSLKDLLRIATAERNAGDDARAAGNVEAAFIHFAKASTLMLEELPGHPKFAELTNGQKEAVQVQGQIIQDQLGQVKSLVTDRFNESRARHQEAEILPHQCRRPLRPQRQRQRTQDANRRSTEEQRRQEEESRARRARHQHEAQMLIAEQRRRQQTTTNGHDQINNIVANARIARQEKDRLEEQKRLQEAAMLGYPTPASLRTRPESYEAPPQPTVPPAQHYVPERSASAAGLQRTNSTARVHAQSVPPPATAPAPAPIPRAPSRTASRADNHYHRPISDPRSRENPTASAPPRSSSRADHRPSAPAAYGASAATNAAYNAAYGPGLAYGANPPTGTSARPRKMSVTSPVKERPPGGGSTVHHPPPMPLSHDDEPHPQVLRSPLCLHPVSPTIALIIFVLTPPLTDPRANGVFPTLEKRPPEQRSSYPTQSPIKHPAPAFPNPEPATRPEPQGILPLESPSHTLAREPEVHAPAPRRNGPNGHGPVRGSSYPPPVTTTSPPPGPISYPTIMTMHQREQGYYPSSHSMFSLAGLATALTAERDIQAFGSPPKQHLKHPLLSYSSLIRILHPRVKGTATRRLRDTAIPDPDQLCDPSPARSPHLHTTRFYPDPRRRGSSRLRQVLLPEEVIQKFMSIAKPNTLRRTETCGLLLGKARGAGFAVTTLLIPRQRGTSDTCEMIEEELILDFQETRGLITLGWIHTHPTQSCFMSSMDLHTHSGYQASLKEAFAIVCAPSSSPNVGIFRLTDPPGMQVILKCTAKESFHPHSTGNIYTVSLESWDSRPVRLFPDMMMDPHKNPA
ncbi:USP8 dimerization domain [Rhizoctonia solani]|uniref:USP8 dimerization domain n=1 Tax=Rhizoctonia solani TaxID=456999 RepID=A0A8H7I9H5_9AGAM|nr:USP8 dimerization domain [Rhizoctonia solani]